MSDPEKYRARAREYAAKAQTARDHDQWLRMKGMAKSFLLLEKNAKWLRSTDRFLDAVKSNRRWPGPEQPVDDQSIRQGK